MKRRTRPAHDSDSPDRRLTNYPIHYLLIAVAAGVVVLAAGLRPDAFYAGDSGVKLIAARAAIAHPATPFEIAFPVIGADSAPHVEPFFVAHGDHAHALTSPLFPVLTAPLLAAFGLRGLYLLPAIGFLVAAAGCASLGVALDARRRPGLIATVAVLGTPFLFYGLEFWEHMPAVACAAMGGSLWLRGRAPWAGLLLGAAILFRPEAGWFAAALIAASPLLPHPPTLKTTAWSIAWALMAMAPYELYVLGHFGTLVPPHVSANASAVAPGWFASRLALLPVWFGTNAGTFWSTGPVVAGAAVALGLPRPLKGQAFLWTVAIVVVVLTLVTSPNDGGSQWGPRYLLFVYVPLTIIAADALDQLPRRNAAAGAVAAVALFGCLWVQRAAYRQLRGTKASYGRVVDFVNAETAESSHIVTDVWWLDQVAASAIGGRQLLFAPGKATAEDILRRLSAQTIPAVTVVRSTTDSPDTSAWIDGTCYFEERRDRISVRDLVAIRLRHRCPQ